MIENVPSEKRKCHVCFFRKSCRDLVLSGACERWTQIKGTHPQTGQYIEQWGCIDDLQHLLLLEIGNQASKVSVEVNVLRNETAKAHKENMTLGAAAVQRARDAVKSAMVESLQSVVPMLPSRDEPVPLLESNPETKN